MPARTRDERPLLERVLDIPHLPQVVPRLPAEVLHRIIQTCGLEDCGDLVALATPGQLRRIFDLDLWRPAQPGLDEQFDPDRFGVWLEVLMDCGPDVTARTLADLDIDLVVAAFAQHVRVYDLAALIPPAPADDDGGTRPDAALSCEVRGYLLVAKRTDAWDTIVAALGALDDERPERFQEVMRGCRRLSNVGFEVDGLDDLLTDRAQAMFDLAVDREERRQARGFVTPPEARAFLDMSRHLSLGIDAAPPPPNPLARAYFRSIEWATVAASPAPARNAQEPPAVPSAADDAAAAVTAVVDMLRDAGVVAPPPRALLDAPQGGASRTARLETQLQAAGDLDPLACSLRARELAFLANVLVAGCAIQGRAFTPAEASEAAAAVCNLGLDMWPRHWRAFGRRKSTLESDALPADFLVHHDLVAVFEVGWTVLYRDVCLYAVERLLDVLTRLRCQDPDIQRDLAELSVELTNHRQAGAPWRARGALDVVAILDTPAWAALLGLIDECPVMPAAVDSRRSGARFFSATAFAFIADSGQVAAVRAFLATLPEALGGQAAESAGRVPGQRVGRSSRYRPV